MIAYAWRGAVRDAELDALHAAAFGTATTHDWNSQLERHSLGWVCARDGDALGIMLLGARE